MGVEYYRVVPTTKITKPLSFYRVSAKKAWDISQAFVMDNDIHYDMFENVWHMDLTKEQATMLTLMLPEDLELNRLTINY